MKFYRYPRKLTDPELKDNLTELDYTSGYSRSFFRTLEVLPYKEFYDILEEAYEGTLPVPIEVVEDEKDLEWLDGHGYSYEVWEQIGGMTLINATDTGLVHYLVPDNLVDKALSILNNKSWKQQDSSKNQKVATRPAIKLSSVLDKLYNR